MKKRNEDHTVQSEVQGKGEREKERDPVKSMEQLTINQLLIFLFPLPVSSLTSRKGSRRGMTLFRYCILLLQVI